MSTIVMLPTITAVAELEDPVELEVVRAELVLDEAWVPFGVVTLYCKVPDSEIVEALDPTLPIASRPRITVAAGVEWITPARSPQARAFDLVLADRRREHGDDEQLVIEATTDELLLMLHAVVADTADDSAIAHQASLRDIIDSRLAAIGAALQPGDVDADFTITSDATNLIKNPRYGESGTTTTGWTTDVLTGGSLSGSGSATGGPLASAPSYRRVTVTGSSVTALARAYGGADLPLTPGLPYVGGVWVRCSISATVSCDLNALSGGTVIDDGPNTPVAVPANTWTYLPLAAYTPPAGTTAGRLRVFTTTTLPVGTTVDISAALLVQGTTAPEYFDGAAADDAYYSYAWTGTAHASTSTRTRLDDRDPALLLQEPGVSDWDFLEPLVKTAGLRLFCDESRAWHLVAAGSYLAPGHLSLSHTTNLVRAADIIRAVGEEWCDAVVVEYSWREAGFQHTRVDYAGDPDGKTLTFRYSRPWPGPGAAAAILSRRQGRARVLELTALLDLTATPSMPLTVTLPDTPIQTGAVSSVRYEWPADELTIGSRGLIDTPPSAWAFLAGTTWGDFAPGQSWPEIF